MVNRAGGRLAVLLIVSAWLTRGAGAQTIRLPLDKPTHELKIGQKITLVVDDGKPNKARIVDLAPDRLVVTVTDGTGRPGAAAVEIPAVRVARVQRGDSLRNGALTGFLIGGGFALNRLGACEINCYGAFVPVLGGIGAVIGTLADALRRDTTVYVTSDRVADARSSVWFFFFSSDRNEPPHVHVRRDAKLAKFWLTPVRQAYNYGFKS